MKTAIYIEDGTVQLVITPESAFEKDAMKAFGAEGFEAKIFRGSFYDCRGGWVRQKPQYPKMGYTGEDENNSDNSLILRMSKPVPPSADRPPSAV